MDQAKTKAGCSSVPLDPPVGHLSIPKMAGKEVSPGVWLIDEPVPRPDLGDNKFACLAEMGGALVLVELSLRLLPVPNASAKGPGGSLPGPA